MKIEVIWSSPNTDGLTAAAAEQVCEGIREAGGEAVSVQLNRCEVAHCRACGNGWGRCSSEGCCVIEDDFAALYDALQVADAVVWVTAVYWHEMTEAMKAMMDRLRRCETAHNHALKGKKCLMVACAGGSGRGAISCLYQMEEAMNHMGMVPVDRLPVTRANRAYMLPALKAAGRAFAER